MARGNAHGQKAIRRRERSRKRLDPDKPIDLLETTELLHRHMTASVCQTVFGRERTTERQREWSLYALAEFWNQVILRAPTALTKALQEAAGGGAGWPAIQTSEEAFFLRCKTLKWTFFAALFAEFVQRILRVAPATFASPAGSLRKKFPELWVLDGSRLDAIAHRLKILWDVRSPVLPGCLLAAYDLFRGIPRCLRFDPDAASAEMNRVMDMLDEIPRGTLLLADRLYASVALFEQLTPRGLWGCFRLNGRLLIRRQKRISRSKADGGVLEDFLVEVGCGATAPKQILRLIRLKRKGTTHEVLTNVLDPKMLSAASAMSLYPLRWNIERMFFHLKEVLNLHRFYAANPNAVAMQVYAAAIVYTAMRVAQSRVARKVGIVPEDISPHKFFARMATASSFLIGVKEGFKIVQRLNPRKRLVIPSVRGQPFVTTTLGAIMVEKRNDHRRKRRFCKGRRRWKSLKHIHGGLKLT